MATVFYSDMYWLDTSTMVWSLINTGSTPPPSPGHSATIIGTKMFVFGVTGNQISIRVFDKETNSWTTPSAQILPDERCFHSTFTYNEELYIFGGIDYNSRPTPVLYNDLWEFNPETFWTKVTPKGTIHLQRIVRAVALWEIGSYSLEDGKHMMSCSS